MIKWLMSSSGCHWYGQWYHVLWHSKSMKNDMAKWSQKYGNDHYRYKTGSMTHITTPNHLTWQWFRHKLILQRNSIYIPISTNVLPRLVSFAQETIGLDLILRKEVSHSCGLQFLETCCQVVWNIDMSIDFNVLYFWGLPHISLWHHNTKYCNHPQKWKSVNYILCSLWVQNAVWNFNAVLWNFTENFEPVHQNICLFIMC